MDITSSICGALAALSMFRGYLPCCYRCAVVTLDMVVTSAMVVVSRGDVIVLWVSSLSLGCHTSLRGSNASIYDIDRALDG